MSQAPFTDPHHHLSDRDYLLASIASQLLQPGKDTDGPTLPNPARVPTQSASSFPHLQALMRSDTQSYIHHALRDLKRDLFILLPSQTRTLQDLSIPQDLIDNVLSLNFLRLRAAPWPVQDRLNTLATLPPTPTGPQNTADWAHWWHTHRDSNIGIHRHHRDAKADPVSQSLDQVIVHMGQTAVHHIPTPNQIAQHISTTPKKGNKSPKPLTRLSQVYTAISDLYRLALSIFLHPKDLDPLHMGDPETILKDLRSNGWDLMEDMGKITTLQALRPLLPDGSLSKISVSIPLKLWHSLEAQESYKITPGDNVYYGKNRSNIFPHGDIHESISHPEILLILNTVPSVPTYSHIPTSTHNPDPTAAALAYLTGTTPEAATDYLTNITPSPEPPPDLSPCPLMEHCPTTCAHLQTKEALAYPFTEDGRYQSCKYWQFLTVHQLSPPEIRESAANQALNLLLQRDTRHAGRTKSGAKPRSTHHPNTEPPLQPAPKDNTSDHGTGSQQPLF